MFTINAEVRKEHGKGASRRLRTSNRFPAIVYGGKEDAVSITLEQDAMLNMMAKEGFYGEVHTLVLDGKEVKVKAQAVQRHAYKPKMLHIDFVRA